MKEEKIKDTIIGVLIGIIISLCVAIIVVTLMKKTTNDNVNVESNKVDLQTGIKLDTNKDYVYDAEYTNENKYTEFIRESNEETDKKQTISYYGIDVDYTIRTQYLSNLKVPHININSEDALLVNEKLKNLYIEKAKLFDTCAQESKNNKTSCSQILTYRTYTYNNVLSVVVINSEQRTANWLLNYDVYNFDLETGKKLTYNELIDKLNYNKNDALLKSKEQLKSKMDEIYGSHVGDLSDACFDSFNDQIDSNKKVNCYEKANSILENSINNDSILAFTDNNGILNLITIAYYNGVENGTLNNYLIKVNK